MHENAPPVPSDESASSAATSTPLASWAQLFAENEKLAHLQPALASEPFAESLATAATERVAFIARLKVVGVTSLTERQKMANVCGQAHKLGRTASRPEEPAAAAAGPSTARSSSAGRSRVWALSDIHTDKPRNVQWIADLCASGAYAADTLILAGDVSEKPALFESTLRSLVAAFGTVFFCPGNHDLWTRADGAAHSLERLDEILKLCATSHGPWWSPARPSRAI
jgi:hypothetical protein